MAQPSKKTRLPDLTDGNIAIYRVVPAEVGKKPYYEIYDGAPGADPAAKVQVKIFPDILGTELDIRAVRDIYRGESPLIRGYSDRTKKTFPAFVCARRPKPTTFVREEGGVGEGYTYELGIAYPKYAKKGEAGGNAELIGYRLWTGRNEPLVDFFATAGSKKQVRLSARDCFSLYDGNVLSLNNHQVKMLRIEESMYEGKPVRLARVSATVINRQRGEDVEVTPAENDELTRLLGERESLQKQADELRAKAGYHSPLEGENPVPASLTRAIGKLTVKIEQLRKEATAESASEDGVKV